MANLCVGTPKITVRDNRGLDVRTLRYNRNAEGAVARQYVDAQAHNALGQPVSSQDPRFFGGSTLNFQYTPALSGQVLQTLSVDAGASQACVDIAGRPFWQHSQGRDAGRQSDDDITLRQYHDALGRPLQRLRITSPVTAGAPASEQVYGYSDLWFYGDAAGPPTAPYDPADASDPRNANQRGQLVWHLDTAGLLDMSELGHGVQGQVLRQDRSFLAQACDANNNWIVSDKPPFIGNRALLEERAYATHWTYNALAQVVTQTDARGHRQHTAYDCAGRKSSSAVTPQGGSLTPVIAAITYTAAGDIDTRTDANGIQVVHVYEPQATQRLISITTTRASEAALAARTAGKRRLARQGRASTTTTLQALAYTYDGVGNVIALADESPGARVTFFRNRVATPDRAYAYDALYQLIGASGRENHVDATPKGTDWPGGTFDPTATPNYQPYTRTYTYDLGGNLTSLGSTDWTGPSATRNLVVGRTSNRAVSTARYPGPTQDNIDTYFDAAGKSICVDGNANQPMYWTPLHQLYCVVTTYRTSSGGNGAWDNSDREQYAYDGDGQRVRKYGSSQAGSAWNHVDTRYLPGLELRNDTGTGEQLEVIVLDDGARVLNWAGGAGKPTNIPNLQLRYQYNDRQNSCTIETDQDGGIISQEEYYPYGGTAVLASRTTSEVNYKFIRYSGKERDVTGFYYYGVRYYQPWIGRWINPDPGGTVDGQNLYCMVGNNPSTDVDQTGLAKKKRGKDEQGLPESKIARMSGPTASASSGPAPGNQDLGPLSLDIPESSTFGPSTSASSGEQGRREDLLKLLRSPIPAPPPLSEEEKAIRMKSPLLYDLLHASGSSGASGLWTSATQGRDAANQMREITELLPARTGQPNTPIDRSISSLGRESRGYVDEWAKGLSSGRCLVLPRTGGWCTPSVALTAQEQAEEPFRATEETFLHGTAAVVETLAAMIRVHVATDELVDIAPVPPGTGNTVVYGNSMLKEFEDAFSPNSLPPVRPDLENEIEGAMSKLCLDAFEHAGIEGVISTDLSEQDIDYDFADRAKGYAFAVYATERAAYIIPGVVNLNVGLSDMPWYKGRGPLFRRMKVKEKQTGKEVTRSVYLKPKTDGQIKEFIKWVNTRLEENGHLPLHAVLEKRFKDFCGRDTTAEDFPPHHKYEPACNREMPALAGVMGTHAETILYNRLLTEIFKDYHGADLEKKEHLANKLFLKYIGVFTMQLLNAKKRVESGIVPFPLFAPCIGCKTMMGPGGMAFQYARIAKSFAENQKDILSVPFDQRNDYLKGKYGFLR